MSTLEELWQWISAPLEELKRDFTAGPEKSWESRRGEFLQKLGIPDPGHHPLTEQMFHELDGMTEEERRNQVSSGQFESVARTFAEHHAVSEEAGQAAATDESYDENAWQDYLTRNGTRWDGTQENWEPFTQWFLYYADESHVKTPATALITYLNPLGASERITELSRYGVTISPPQAQPAQEPAGSEPGLAETGVAADEEATSVMADLLTTNPEFAGIPEERRMELMNEALSELRGAPG